MKTMMSEALDSVNAMEKYDAACKMLLSQKVILARILKHCIPEFQYYSADEIADKFIEDADCKLTLYRNCRNTENIAITSLRPLSERKPKLHEGCVKGVPANFYFASDDDRAIECVDDVIEKLRTDGFKDIVILTCKTEESSLLSSRASTSLHLAILAGLSASSGRRMARRSIRV